MTVTRKMRCVVHKILDHGSGVYTLELIPEKILPIFKPGQFLHLALDEYDPSGFWPESRAFSIASSPQIRDILHISYAVKGLFTGRMEVELSEGKQVWIKLPYGEFIVEGGNPTALIAGGTGITPFCAFIEELRPDQSNDIHLFYGARSEELLIYRDKITKVSRSVPRFHASYFVEVPTNTDVLEEDFQPIAGRLAIDQIWSMLPNPMQTVYYLSGPPIMLKAFSDELQHRHLPMDKIRIDSWE